MKEERREGGGRARREGCKEGRRREGGKEEGGEEKRDRAKERGEREKESKLLYVADNVL